MLLSGVAGSGKTSLKLLLTDQPPPSVRQSTVCLEKPVRVNIRPVTSTKYKTTGRGWVEISQEKLLSLLAQIIAEHPKQSRAQSMGMRVTGALQKMTSSSGSNPGATMSHESIPSNTETGPSVIGEAIDETIESLVNEVAQKLKVTECEHVPASMNHREGGELFDSTWVYISDCGGQPQFHDISPIFIRHVSVAAIVLRLIDDFSSFPLDEYYKDGQLMGPPHASHMTLEETLKSLIRSIESHCSQEKKPKLIFVGTFLDQLANITSLKEKNQAVLDMVPASMKEQLVYNKGLKHPILDQLVSTIALEEKNKAVLDMMPVSMEEQVVFNESLKQPIFALNTLSREEDACGTAESIRKAIEACHPLEIRVPIWWFFLDFNLQVLACRLERGVLRKVECLKLAVRFGFESEDLEAALVFFNEVCIAHYYPSILPEKVFVNAQIPLDKISELTEYAITLRNANTKGTIDGKLKRMTQGVITLEFLKLDQFKKHYIKGLFSPEDMLLIMKELLVLAPIPLVGEPECSLSNAEFFMPSLLNSVLPAELQKYRISSDTISPIAIRFPSGSIRSGIFCCLIVYTMKVSKWDVLLPNTREPVLLAKNCIRFRFPGRPCTITLIDSFSYIEVYIQSLPAVGKELCPTIRNQLLNGIQAACDVLHYNNDTPQVSIFCPCALSAEKLHLAEIDSSGYWICLSKDGVWGELPPQDKVWLLERPNDHQGKYHHNYCIKSFFN